METSNAIKNGTPSTSGQNQQIRPSSLRHVSSKTGAVLSNSVNGVVMTGSRQIPHTQGGVGASGDIKRENTGNLNGGNGNNQAVSRQSLTQTGQKSSILMNSGGLAMNIKEGKKSQGANLTTGDNRLNSNQARYQSGPNTANNNYSTINH